MLQIRKDNNQELTYTRDRLPSGLALQDTHKTNRNNIMNADQKEEQTRKAHPELQWVVSPDCEKPRLLPVNVAPTLTSSPRTPSARKNCN